MRNADSGLEAKYMILLAKNESGSVVVATKARSVVRSLKLSNVDLGKYSDG
jgi:hypothetical protein